MNNPPSTVFLQWHGDGDPSDTGPVDDGDVTWCREKVFHGDIEFVTASVVLLALGGHRCSELLGDHGLLAATMRSLDHAELLREAVAKLRDAKGRHNSEVSYRRLMELFPKPPPNTAPAAASEKAKGTEPFQIQCPSLAPALGLEPRT